MASRIGDRLAAVLAGALSVSGWAGLAFGQTTPVQEWWRIMDPPPYDPSEEGPGVDSPADIDVDIYGNVFVTGYTQTGTGLYKAYTVRYTPDRDTNNNPLGQDEAFWPPPTTTSPGFVEGRALTVNGGGTVLYVVGQAPGSDGEPDIILLRYDAATLDLHTGWTSTGDGAGVRRYDRGVPNMGLDIANAVATDGAGNVYIAGVSASASASAASKDYIVLKYDDSGVLQWAVTYNGAGNGADEAIDLVVEDDNELSAGEFVYVTDTSWGGSVRKNDIVTLQLDASDGSEIWRHRYNGPVSKDDTAAGIVLRMVGGASRVYVAGTATAHVADGFGGESFGFTAIQWDKDYVTFRLEETDPTPLTEHTATWTRLYDGPAASGDRAFAICLADDSSEYVFVVGTSTGSGTGLDIKAIAYEASTGNDVWSSDSDGRYDGAASDDDWGFDIAELHDGLFVTGATTDSGGDVDMVTYAFDPATGAARWSSAQIYDGGDGDDVGKKIAVDHKDISEPCGVKKPVVTGDTFKSSTDFNFRTIRYVECTTCSGPCP